MTDTTDTKPASESGAEVYAVKFGAMEGGNQGRFFQHPPAEFLEQPGHLDFMVWVIRTGSEDIVVDAGLTYEVAEKRNRPIFQLPSEAVRSIGVDPARVSNLILSHLHYDHAGDLDPFTTARVVVQESEMRFWTGPYARRGEFGRLVELHDLQRLIALNLEGRLLQVSGDREVAPGVTVHLVGGHTAGMQIVSVATARGTVVLASDASHLQAHIEQDQPADVATDVPRMYAAFDRISALASSPELIIPGHDPKVFERFPAVPGLEGRAVRIA
jgi:glyoxylase-like metal-dependent hydrolase (beta-lactamase superfamily II)